MVVTSSSMRQRLGGAVTSTRLVCMQALSPHPNRSQSTVAVCCITSLAEKSRSEPGRPPWPQSGRSSRPKLVEILPRFAVLVETTDRDIVAELPFWMSFFRIAAFNTAQATRETGAAFDFVVINLTSNTKQEKTSVIHLQEAISLLNNSPCNHAV